MKKLLGILLVMTMAWPAPAEVFKNVDLKGEVQVIGSDVNRNSPTNNVKLNSGTNVRVLAGASFDLVEDVRANLLFQYGNMWGSAPVATQLIGSNGSTMQDYWNKVTLVEGNIVLSNLFDRFELKVGRQFYGEEDSAVIYFGPTHYNAEGVGLANSLDAAKLVYGDDVKSFTVLAGKIAMENTLLPMNEQHASIFGADFKMNITDTLKAQVYAYDVRNGFEYQRTVGAPTLYPNAGFYGAKLGFTPGKFKFNAEYAHNFAGQDLFEKLDGYMLKFDAAMTVGAFTPRAAFVYSAEEFVAFGNYRPGIIVGDSRHGNVFDYYENGEGLRLFNVGLDYAINKWTFALDMYSFQDRYAHHGATYEYDLTAKYAHNQYVELFAGVGYINNGLQNRVEGFDRDLTKGQLGMLIKF